MDLPLNIISCARGLPNSLIDNFHDFKEFHFKTIDAIVFYIWKKVNSDVTATESKDLETYIVKVYNLTEIDRVLNAVILATLKLPNKTHLPKFYDYNILFKINKIMSPMASTKSLLESLKKEILKKLNDLLSPVAFQTFQGMPQKYQSRFEELAQKQLEADRKIDKLAKKIDPKIIKDKELVIGQIDNTKNLDPKKLESEINVIKNGSNGIVVEEAKRIVILFCPPDGFFNTQDPSDNYIGYVQKEIIDYYRRSKLIKREFKLLSKENRELNLLSASVRKELNYLYYLLLETCYNTESTRTFFDAGYVLRKFRVVAKPVLQPLQKKTTTQKVDELIIKEMGKQDQENILDALNVLYTKTQSLINLKDYIKNDFNDYPPSMQILQVAIWRTSCIWETKETYDFILEEGIRSLTKSYNDTRKLIKKSIQPIIAARKAIVPQTQNDSNSKDIDINDINKVFYLRTKDNNHLKEKHIELNEQIKGRVEEDGAVADTILKKLCLIFDDPIEDLKVSLENYKKRTECMKDCEVKLQAAEKAMHTVISQFKQEFNKYLHIKKGHDLNAYYGWGETLFNFGQQYWNSFNHMDSLPLDLTPTDQEAKDQQDEKS